MAPDIDGNVVVWTWDEAGQTVVRNELLQKDAAAVSAARLYRDLAWLESEDTDVRVRSLIAKLQVDQSLGGLDSPLRQGPGTAYELASRAGNEVLQQVLALSLETGHHAAALGAARAARQFGRPVYSLDVIRHIPLGRRAAASEPSRAVCGSSGDRQVESKGFFSRSQSRAGDIGILHRLNRATRHPHRTPFLTTRADDRWLSRRGRICPGKCPGRRTAAEAEPDITGLGTNPDQ